MDLNQRWALPEHAPLEIFAKEVGGADDGPVTCVGGRTQWDVGGLVDPGARDVRAPAGIVAYEPAEMVVRVRAGTVVADLAAALAPHGQQVVLDPVQPEAATVGGVLAVGRSGFRRLRYGPVRDVVLEATAVLFDGRLVRAGGPVVKNVSGYDLCRLLVGSLGTLGLLAEVVLRCAPKPPVSVWLASPVGQDPFVVRDRLFRPSSILWDGERTWVLLEGHDADVEAESSSLGPEWHEVPAPPALPAGGRNRRSFRPSALRELHGGQFLAEVGVGTVHVAEPAPTPQSFDAATAGLQRRLKEAFDPVGRLNPGRQP